MPTSKPDAGGLLAVSRPVEELTVDVEVPVVPGHLRVVAIKACCEQLARCRSPAC